MNVLQGIRRAYEDYNVQYMYSPAFVYMNRKTFCALKAESNVPEDYEKRFIPQVFGMTIVNKEELPDGVVVVGGIIRDCRTDDDTGLAPVYLKKENYWVCGNCLNRITWAHSDTQNHGKPLQKWAYCKNCGKRVDWDGIKGRT